MAVRKTRETELSKTTIRIYLYMMSKNEPLGPREIMRELGLSTPSLVYYHLKKLEEQGLVKKTSSGYVAVPGIKIEGYIQLGRKLVPRLLLYSFIYLGILVIELMGLMINLSRNVPVSREYVILIIFTSMTAMILLIEGLRSCRLFRE